MSGKSSPIVTLGIMLAALSASVAVYIVLAWLILHSQDQPSSLAPEILARLRSPLFVLGLALLALPHMLESALLSRIQPGATSSSPHATVYIIGLAVCETTAVIGLLLFFLGLPFREFLYFAAASLAGILVWGVPRLRPYAEAMERSSR